MNQIILSGGEIDLNIEALLNQNKSQLAEKLDSYGYVIEALKRRQEYAVERMKEWSKVAGVCDKSLENLQNKIINTLQQLELDSIHGKEFTFKTQLNPLSVNVLDESKIPGEYIVTETKVINKVDKRAIAEKFKDTEEIVPGVELTRSSRLVLKPSDRKSLNGDT